MLKLDYVSCILTIISTVLIGKKLWQGWVITGANSIIICLIGMRTAQFGFVPANLFVGSGNSGTVIPEILALSLVVGKISSSLR
jgi:hypothetical protein